MLALIWGAVRSRRAQMLAVLVLTALAAAVAAAGPWFAGASSTRAAAADVAAAPPGQRVVAVRKIADTGGDPAGTLRELNAQVARLFPLASDDAALDALVMSLDVARAGVLVPMPLAYREDFCDHVRLEGDCPARPLEVAISQDASQQLGIVPGSTLNLRPTPGSEGITYRVVASFTPLDPSSTFWSNQLLEAEGGGFAAAYTPIETFEERSLWEPTVSYDLPLPEHLLRGDDGYDLWAVLREADVRLSGASLSMVDPTSDLLATIYRDRVRIENGVLVATLQILVLAWFAIGLTGRYTGRDRRGDAALLKLRGSTRGGMLRLAWGQHLVPLTAGTLLGAPLGLLAARLAAGPIDASGERVTALLLAAAAGAAVLVGGLLVLAVIEAMVLRHPVAALLRQVRSGRGDWRSGLVDLLLLGVAVAAVYQARSGAATSGVALAAPALVALAVALLLARLLSRVADRGGGAAVRSGRLRLGLTAVQVSRQPGSDRVFALVVVAVALFVTAAGGWRGEQTARIERSEAELGAVRVLTVQAANRTALLAAVRRADPAGDRAMAAVVDRSTPVPVLAVDSARLAAVARWRPEFGPAGTLAGTTAGGVIPEALPAVTGARLSVALTYRVPEPVPVLPDPAAPDEPPPPPVPPGPAALALVLQHQVTGEPVTVRFGTLRPGPQTRAAAVTGCTAAPGCRIVRWELTSPPDAAGRALPAPPGSEVTLRALTQQSPAATLLDGARLADIARWRPGAEAAAVDVAARGRTLRLTVATNDLQAPQAGTQVWSVDAALPLPLILAGPAPTSWELGESRLSTLGVSPVPVQVAGTADALPVLGRSGILIDLAAARQVMGDANPPGQFQVWLAPGAGSDVVGDLTAAGLRVTGEETVAARSARLAEQAPATVTRFALVCGAVGLLLAAAAITVAGAVDRRSRLDQLRALRVQGLDRRAAVVTAYAGTVVLIGAGIVAGLLAALLAVPAARVTLLPFTDGWDVLPAPGALGGVAFGLGAAVAVAVLGLAGWLSVLPLIRRLRGSSEDAR